jgi:hypothetical protein
VPVAFIPIPDIKNYITNMIVEDTPTSFGMLSENYGRDSTFSKHFKVIEHFEVLTTDPFAEEVAVRISFKLEYLDHPFGY